MGNRRFCVVYYILRSRSKIGGGIFIVAHAFLFLCKTFRNCFPLMSG